MTKRQFMIPYLMGVYHEKQLDGRALMDIPFEQSHPSKQSLAQAEHQYELFLNISTQSFNKILDMPKRKSYN